MVVTMTTRLAAAELDKQLAELKNRPDAEYGNQVRVDRVVEEERGRFAAASIRSFLPILIGRSVRSRLAATHR